MATFLFWNHIPVLIVRANVTTQQNVVPAVLLLRETKTERGNAFFGALVSSGGGRVSVIAREALFIDCDFLLQLLFSEVSPEVSEGTSYSYAII